MVPYSYFKSCQPGGRRERNDCFGASMLRPSRPDHLYIAMAESNSGDYPRQWLGRAGLWHKSVKENPELV